MLNVQEIKELEERWRRYKKKNLIGVYTLVFVAFVALSAISYAVYSYGFSKSGDKISNTMSQLAKMAKTALGKSHQDKAKPKESIAVKQVDKNVTSKAILPSKTKIVKSVSKNKDEKKVALKASNVVENNKTTLDAINNYNNVLILNTEFREHVKERLVAFENREKELLAESENDTSYSEPVEEDNKQQQVVENDDQSAMDAEEQEVDQRPKILISSTKIDKIKYLQDRYNATGKAQYAISLSKEYYKKQDYQKALNWAIVANDIDSASEDSWIMFAKSKVKLGLKQDAVKALRVYLQNYRSIKIERLLTDIQNGVVK